MDARQALLLVREKWLEEQQGTLDGSIADRYRDACIRFPALMTVAHHMWARELWKDLP